MTRPVLIPSRRFLRLHPTFVLKRQAIYDVIVPEWHIGEASLLEWATRSQRDLYLQADSLQLLHVQRGQMPHYDTPQSLKSSFDKRYPPMVSHDAPELFLTSTFGQGSRGENVTTITATAPTMLWEDVLCTAATASKSDDAIFLVCEDEERCLEILKLKCLKINDVRSHFEASVPSLSTPIRMFRLLKVAEKVTHILALTALMLSPVLISVVFVSAGTFLSTLMMSALNSWPTWTTALLALLIGMSLYLFRCRGRAVYGLVECGFGMALTYFAAASFAKSVSYDTAFKLCTGLYVIVRGFDNIGKWIKNSETPLARLLKGGWRAVFGNDYA